MRRGPSRIALAIACAPFLSGASEDGPGDYAVRIAVTPAPGGGIQRLAVPAQALAASRSGGLADLRIFDADGRTMPIAIGRPANARPRRTIRLPALPILGPPGAPGVTGLSLKVTGDGASVVRVDGAPADARGPRVLGALFDTRGLEGSIERVTLDVDLPRGQPVAFTIDAGDDLTDWRTLATRTLYRPGAAGADGALALDPTQPAGRYLRVTWDAGRLVSPVTVRGAAIGLVGAADPARLPRAIVRGATAEGSRIVAFALPAMARIAALEIVAADGDTVVPVRILGRDAAEQPWRLLAAGTVYRITQAGSARRNPPFPLAETPRLIRIQADARTPGFTAPPEIAVRFDPVSLLFLAGGRPPYALAAGRADATDAALPAASLVPGYAAGGEASLPRAATPPAPDPEVEAAAPGAGRGLLLWAILLGGTALLAAMVWRLLRQRAPVSPAP